MNQQDVKNLTNEQLKWKVAELLGWIQDTEYPYHWTNPSGKKGWHAASEYDEETLIEPPNYPTDLNACHEMEKTISHSHTRKKYFLKLVNHSFISEHLVCAGDVEAAARATARQRSETFVLVMTEGQ